MDDRNRSISYRAEQESKGLLVATAAAVAFMLTVTGAVVLVVKYFPYGGW